MNFSKVSAKICAGVVLVWPVVSVLAACHDEPPPASPTEVTVTPMTPSETVRSHAAANSADSTSNSLPRSRQCQDLPAVCQGKLSPELQKSLEDRAQHTGACFDREHATNPTLDIEVRFNIKVDGRGSVCGRSAGMSSGSRTLYACINDAFAGPLPPLQDAACFTGIVPFHYAKSTGLVVGVPVAADLTKPPAAHTL